MFNLKQILMILGNRLVQERKFFPSIYAESEDADGLQSTLPIIKFTNWINGSKEAQEILSDMGVQWPMTVDDLKRNELYDAFDLKLNAGDTVDVQKAGHHKIYEIAGELVFCPYGEPELVRSYFKQDIHKVVNDA